jgi:SPP1 family predicted phage head-tail adaptor
MQAGRLRHMVTLQQKTATRDEFGGEIETWTDVLSAFAEIDPWLMRERLTMRRQTGESAIGFRVRSSVTASLGDRLVFDGVNYNVVDIDPSLKHRGELLITAVAEDAEP